MDIAVRARKRRWGDADWELGLVSDLTATLESAGEVDVAFLNGPIPFCCLRSPATACRCLRRSRPASPSSDPTPLVSTTTIASGANAAADIKSVSTRDGLRNRIVHDYETLDNRILFDSAKRLRKDARVFLSQISHSLFDLDELQVIRPYAISDTRYAICDKPSATGG